MAVEDKRRASFTLSLHPQEILRDLRVNTSKVIDVPTLFCLHATGQDSLKILPTNLPSKCRGVASLKPPNQVVDTTEQKRNKKK